MQQLIACWWLPDTTWGSSDLFSEICPLWEEINLSRRVPKPEALLNTCEGLWNGNRASLGVRLMRTRMRNSVSLGWP